MTNSELIIQNWGSGVEYQSAWDRQRELHHKIVTENHPDVAVLLEHQNVYTAGRSTKPEDRPTDSSPVFDIDRGGRITWHGPGQIVCYPIMKLDDPVDVVAHVRRLELLIMNVCSKVGLETTQIEGRSGVWVKGNGLPDKKIAAIGIRVAKKATMHGFALNVNANLGYFDNIIPCGIKGKAVTSMHVELGRAIDENEVKEKIVKHFQILFEALFFTSEI